MTKESKRAFSREMWTHRGTERHWLTVRLDVSLSCFLSLHTNIYSHEKSSRHRRERKRERATDQLVWWRTRESEASSSSSTSARGGGERENDARDNEREETTLLQVEDESSSLQRHSGRFLPRGWALRSVKSAGQHGHWPANERTKGDKDLQDRQMTSMSSGHHVEMCGLSLSLFLSPPSGGLSLWLIYGKQKFLLSSKECDKLQKILRCAWWKTFRVWQPRRERDDADKNDNQSGKSINDTSGWWWWSWS